MITFNDVKEHVNFYKEHYLNILTNYKKENIYLLKNISVDMTRWINQYFIEISKINIECENKIENIQDVIIPTDIFQGLTAGVWNIQTDKHIYICKNSIFKDSEFWFAIDRNTINYKEKLEKHSNWETHLYNIYTDKIYTPRIHEIIKKKDNEYKIHLIKCIQLKFLTDFNNNFDIFPKLYENTKNYYVLENIEDNIQNCNIALSKKVLIDNRYDIIDLLQPLFNFNNKYNFKYSFVIEILDNNKLVNINDLIYSYEGLNSYSIYNCNTKNIKLNYVMNGKMKISNEQYIAFRTEDEVFIYSKNRDLEYIKNIHLNIGTILLNDKRKKWFHLMDI